MTDLSKFAGFKAEQHHLEKLRLLASTTGLTTGDILRALVENAEVKAIPVLRPVVALSDKSKSATSEVYQAEQVGAFASVNP